jgi:tRNA U34 5-methylaminomethyl-2-thiouridine-forming methyltransferase MnmC
MNIPNSGEREVKLIETEDGSHSLYVPSLNETYHSFHGAIRESRYVFIKEGLINWMALNNKPKVRILEVGFGTGLNALLTLDYAQSNKTAILYHTLEPYPLKEDVVRLLNYPSLLHSPALEEHFNALHLAPWDCPNPLTPTFMLQKHQRRLEDFVADPESFDIVYFDAFAPNKQAELWTIDMLEKVFKFLAAKGIIVTYCAKGQLKRDLKSLGFEVETLPGPPGKKEMVRGVKL